MPHFDASSAECLVLTYKEGLLAAIAHDLEIRVERFDMDVEEAPLAARARFDAGSLKVIRALTGSLSESDQHKIEQTIVDEVLHAREYPTILFVSSSVTPEGDAFRITGELTLHGRTRTLSFLATPEGDRMVATVPIHQPDFGIKPYSALLGTLKVKPDVTVRASVLRASLPEP